MIVVMMVTVMIVVVMIMMVIMVVVAMAVMMTVVMVVVIGHGKGFLSLVMRSPFLPRRHGLARNVQISSKDVQAPSEQRGIGCAGTDTLVVLTLTACMINLAKLHESIIGPAGKRRGVAPTACYEELPACMTTALKSWCSVRARI